MTENHFHVATWQDAEENAARWMRHWGYKDARVTAAGADGGIDVVSSHAVAQVKFKAHQVGGPDVQRLAGAGYSHPGKQLIFFTGTGYSAQALQVAEAANVALFTYTLSGQMTAANAEAVYVQTAGDESQRAGAVNRYRATTSMVKSSAQQRNAPSGLLASLFSAVFRFYGWIIRKFLEFGSEVVRVALHKAGRRADRFPPPTKSTFSRAGWFLIFLAAVVLIGGISSTTDPASTASHTQKVWAIVAESVGGGLLLVLGGYVLFEGRRFKSDGDSGGVATGSFTP